MVRISRIAAVGGCLFFVLAEILSPSATGAPPAAQSAAIITANPAPTPEQIHALVERTIANQHKNDSALEQFERIERVVTRKGENAEVVSDRTLLIVPSGTGVMRLPIAHDGVPVPPEEYRRQLEYAVTALDLALHPTERYQEDAVKFERRRRERSAMVDAAGQALRATWAGRETRADSTGARTVRILIKLQMDPDPNYRPTLRLATIFQHVHATVWVDEEQAQLVRVEGDIASDVTFAAGLVGKINHGGHFLIEQTEVEPGVWLPALFTYDVDGRKLMFQFALHEHTEVTNYRRIGPPAQAIEVIRAQLNHLPAEPASTSPTR